MIMEAVATSSRVRARDFRESWLIERATELDDPLRVHRKLWELCVIAQVAKEHVPTRALGFGVGRERLASWFAKHHVSVIATDHPQGTDAWTKTNQHAASLQEIFFPSVCSRSEFYQCVQYRSVDMNVIPWDLKQGQFDLTWSCGSFEHLGSIANGLSFFCEQMKCLRTGGIAIHTTEYNVASGDTLEHPDIVLFQERHFLDLEQRIAAQGDRLLPLDLTSGNEFDDTVIDSPPWNIPHLNIQIGSFVTTSVVLIAIRQ